MGKEGARRAVVTRSNNLLGMQLAQAQQGMLRPAGSWRRARAAGPGCWAPLY